MVGDGDSQVQAGEMSTDLFPSLGKLHTAAFSSGDDSLQTGKKAKSAKLKFGVLGPQFEFAFLSSLPVFQLLMSEPGNEAGPPTHT